MSLFKSYKEPVKGPENNTNKPKGTISESTKRNQKNPERNTSNNVKKVFRLFKDRNNNKKLARKLFFIIANASPDCIMNDLSRTMEAQLNINFPDREQKLWNEPYIVNKKVEVVSLE
ncbi:hypothetical protein AVEN_180680-1 [Araneus ventricosus]|uniref:Uncharacterized protein n=1 Tax=Araneus ventricosus TaxID=182803 RepID=A0A4Y2LTK8_ARAVE|nr:hypothetical protein AVEN_180680-1 [Araneus ventricosus]